MIKILVHSFVVFLQIGAFLFSQFALAQSQFPQSEITLGKLTPIRTCFNVVHQDITVKVEPDKQFITVTNAITFLLEKESKTIQLDLFAHMNVIVVGYSDNALPFKRDSNTLLIDLPANFEKGKLYTILVMASGKPIVAKKAPWDGGFVWNKDENGNHWVGLACESLGASSWLPCKDHWSDEADSVDIHLSVPSNLVGVSNGKLLSTVDEQNGFTRYNWEVKNPINNYNITINIGKYSLIKDDYLSRLANEQPLSLDYYVLDYNEKTAKNYFKQTHKMLEAFEHYFGAYPFANDGYKLVETPYWGMEHQSCVAYGNNFKMNDWGFDFILVHESGHEWFGNSLTASDAGDMWIHESFTTYSEALYVEYWNDSKKAKEYLKEQRKNIENKSPMVGPYQVHFHNRTDNDIYYKGSWMLHTLRNAIDDDTLWFNTLRDFSTEYKKRVLSTKDVVDFFNKRTGKQWNWFYEQYLMNAEIPQFEYKIETKEDGRLTMIYRWSNTVHNFEMPIQVTVTKGKFETITPRKKWQLIDLNYFDEKDFQVKADSYLINIVKKVKSTP